MRVEQIDLSGVPELSTIKPPKFTYDVIPPSIPPRPGEKLKTVFMFAGGPGSVLSDAPRALPHERLIIADYVGMGQNALAQVRSGVDDRNMSLDTYSKLIEQVVRREKDRHGMGDYLLFGHSFGSVAATVVGSYLSHLPDSQSRYRPGAVLEGRVMPFTDAAPANDLANGDANADRGLETQPRISGNSVCVLPQGESCFDDQVLGYLNTSEKKAIQEKLSSIYSGYRQDHPTPFQSFFSDAFHWESVSNPRNAADFLKTYLLNESSSKLFCWYQNHFDEIPWLNEIKNASLIASIAALNCQMNFPDPRCSCFANEKRYDSSYQVASPTRFYVVNGDGDTQTPFEGAQANFDRQTNPNKFLLKICHGGHDLYGPPGKPGAVDLDRLLRAALSSNPKDFESIPSFCQGMP